MNTEIQTLLAMRDRLNKQIEEAIKKLPEKQQLDAVNLLIESAQKKEKSIPSFNDSDTLMRAVVSYFEGNGNAPSTMKDIVTGIETQGIWIDSRRPGTSIAAIMTRSDKWNGKFKNKDGLWSLK